MTVITFQQALAQTADSKRHLLLGNGFSISLFPNRFSYGSLLGLTDFSAHPEAREAFEILGTTDFEVFISALRQAVLLTPLYGGDAAAQTKMSQHAEALKELLVQAIAGTHPERPGDITEEQYRSCRDFLSHFIGRHRNNSKDLRGCVYTLNYDLLLYWTLLHDETSLARSISPWMPPKESSEPLLHDDGFRAPDEELDAEYVTWDGEAAHQQNIHHLHGALHPFDHGFQLQKKRWERSGGPPLIDQIVNCIAVSATTIAASRKRHLEGLSRVSWKLSRTLLRGVVSGNADRLLDTKVPKA